MTNSDRPEKISTDFLSRIQIMMSKDPYILISGANKYQKIIGDACVYIRTIGDALILQICQIVWAKILQEHSDALNSKKKINYDALR